MTAQYLVSGEVQGVGFRYFVSRKARALSLAGWVRNLPDGRVEVVARGASIELRTLEDALARGPGSARVASVDKSEISDEVSVPRVFEVR